MILSELLIHVDTLIPNSIHIPIKIAWMNQVQNQLFRDYPTAEAVEIIDIKARREFYALPDSCPEDRIQRLVIGNKSYDYIPTPEESDGASGQFFTVTIGTILISPIPTEAGSGYLFYKPRPSTLSVDNLDAAPTFPSDYHELLVLGCASRVAKASENLKMAAIFDADYLRLADEADRKLTKVKPKTVANVRRWY